MAEDKKGFILYADLITAVKKLTLKDRVDKTNNSGELFLHLLEYVNDLNPEPINFIVDLSFEPIKNQLKRDLDKWEKTLEGRSRAGKASAAARANKKEQALTNSTSVKSVVKNPTNPTDSVNDSVTVTDSVNVNNIITREADFKKSLHPFLDKYGKDVLNEFYLYWTEKNPNGKKLKFEFNKTFDISRRLAKWNSNNFKNHKNGKQDQQKQLIKIADGIREQNPNI